MWEKAIELSVKIAVLKITADLPFLRPLAPIISWLLEKLFRKVGVEVWTPIALSVLDDKMNGELKEVQAVRAEIKDKNIKKLSQGEIDAINFKLDAAMGAFIRNDHGRKL